MEKLILFIAEQWMLVAALASCLLLLSYHESRRAGRALSPQQVVTLVNQEQALVIDLRDKVDFNKGHIMGAIHLPYAKLEQEIEQHSSDMDKPLVLVCKLGQHASTAGKKLAAKGYKNVNRLKGGISEWRVSQMPLVK